MKENSIETDIKILENFINWLKTDLEILLKENEDITQQRDYYKARYNEFNNAFIEGGKKLTSK